MIVLVTGDREWTERALLFATLDEIHAETPITLLVEGCARGADKMAGDHYLGWARQRGVKGAHFPADWRHYGRGAGVIRNQQMLVVARPETVVAFHFNLAESRGTADMVRRARAAGVPVTVVV